MAMMLALTSTSLFAQENSPYSRYGMGDLLSGQNISCRAMGGISAAYSDYGILGAPFNINLANPASLGFLSNTRNFSNTIFDIGTEVNNRTLKNNSSTSKYSSTNAYVSYLQVAFPVSTPKMEKRGTTWGVSFGLKPLSRVSYKVEQNSRISGIDSVNSLFEGNGGLNQANVSTGIRFIGKGKQKNELAIGFSSGYNFGNRSLSTRTSIVNDTIDYYKSNIEVQTRFGGVFLNTGLQYEIHLKKGATIRLGAYANLQQNLKASQNSINETFGYDLSGGVVSIDSVSKTSEVKGEVNIPATYGAGFTYQSKNKQWLVGADFETTNWNDFRFYGEKDQVQSTWTIKAGAELYPAKSNVATNRYWNYIKYRAGFYYGPDYIRLTESRNRYAVTFGAGFPLTTPRLIQGRGEYVALNTSFELGSVGNNTATGFRENNLRVNVGISMNARWFQKRSYE
jgi:hypothetical protein